MLLLAFSGNSQTIQSPKVPQIQTIETKGTNILRPPNPKELTIRQHHMNHGNVPYYPPGSTPEQNRKINQAYYKSQMVNQTGYSNPDNENDFKQGNAQLAVHQEMMGLLNESRANNTVVKQKQHYASPNYQKDLPNYLKAKDKIIAMLEDKEPVSLKDAYYHAEAAYGGIHLEYDEFNSVIQKNKEFILQWLDQNKYDINNPEALHYGIQQFMSDTLWIEIDDPDQVLGRPNKVAHYPFYYDYVDYTSTKDRRNYFLTKTLATGSGQCHTLPVTYLILAEALGVEAHLSFNPDHSFIRYQNNKGTWLNYETTVGRFVPDQVYFDMLPTMSKAHQNQMYINGLSKKQVLSTILIDLSVNFIREHWFGDGLIVNDCIQTAEKYFPNREFINTPSYALKKKILAQRFNNLVEEKGISNLQEIEQHPEVRTAYYRLKNYLEKAKKMGVEEFPEGEYMKIMAYHDKKERLQKAQNVDTKTKRDLFINY